METTKIARIAVSAATYVIDKPYAYVIPESMVGVIERGMRVLVPFGRGNRISEGIVLSVEDGTKKRGLKAILSVLDETSVLDQSGIRLALWLRDRYFCTMYDAVHTILPAGLWFHTQIIYRICDGLHSTEVYNACEGIPDALRVLDIIYASNGQAEIEVLKKACGVKITGTLKTLCEKGILRCDAEAIRHVKDGKTKMVSLAVLPEEAMAAVETRKKSAPLRYEAIKLLCSTGDVSQAELCYFTGASSATIASLKKSGLIEVYEEEKLRIDAQQEVLQGAEIVLNEDQNSAFAKILELTKKEEASAVLLHGVTGSGKTQVYIRVVQEVIAQGKTAMVLVPEIALTPQMMNKFAAYFHDEVVMLHSALRVTERYDQWKRIKRGEVKLVLGTRSAIFAPLKNIGMIILDEEQESSYQSENPPRYHAKEVAQYLCAIHHAVLVLGSATPSIESAYAARNGVYHYVPLRKRYNQQTLPRVIFADMKEEICQGNAGVISTRLQAELKQNIQRGEQSILLLNRRGSSRMLLCGECGYVPECPRCSVPLTYHSANGRLMCHYCGHSERAKDTCDHCGGIMKHIGTGTQKAEEELHSLFPNVEILRMDADTVSIKGGHEKILSQFSEKQIPILLGTQMVAKGLDFENVTLVGVLAADLSLYVDHYCAAERTFSLLTQVIGRAGRGKKDGRAIIQTFTPENEVLQCAAQQDYERFYESEIRMRKLHASPPFADLFTLVVSGMDENHVLHSCVMLRDAMKSAISQNGQFDGDSLQIVGPAPAPVTKVNNRYRYHVYLVGKNNKKIRSFIEYYIKAFSLVKENRGLSIFVHCNAND